MALKEYGIIENGIYGCLRKKLHDKGYKTVEPDIRRYIKKNEKLVALVRRLVIKD